jgi:hypothetical protein
MLFDDATRYKLTLDAEIKYLTKEEMAIFLHKWNLSYRYVAKSAHKGILEFFNDYIDIIFDVVLYD